MVVFCILIVAPSTKATIGVMGKGRVIAKKLTYMYVTVELCQEKWRGLAAVAQRKDEKTKTIEKALWANRNGVKTAHQTQWSSPPWCNWSLKLRETSVSSERYRETHGILGASCMSSALYVSRLVSCFFSSLALLSLVSSCECISLGSDNAKEGSGAQGKMIIFPTEKSRVILLLLHVSPNAFAVASKSLWKHAPLT